jgi:hypothetical protein
MILSYRYIGVATKHQFRNGIRVHAGKDQHILSIEGLGLDTDTYT